MEISPQPRLGRDDEVVSRRSLWIAGAYALATAAVLTVLWGQLQSDRQELVTQIEAARVEQLDEVVRLVREDVQEVVDDLLLMSQVVERIDEPRRRDVLEALLATVKAYRGAAVYMDGQPMTLVTDPRREPNFDRTVYDAIEQAIDSLGEQRGVIVSRPLNQGEEWFRVFGSRSASGITTVLVVDTAPWLSGLRLVSSDPLNRILVLGPSGGVAPATDETVRRLIEAQPPLPDVHTLLVRMRAGQRGTLRLSGARLGDLEPGGIVVAYSPIEVPESAPWSVAIFTSTAVLEAQEAALSRRFVIAAVLIVVLVLGFAVYVAITARRQAVLVERLHHAGELAAVNAQLLHAEKLATVGGLSAGIAHEIGTPLGVVRGRAEYLLRKLGEDHAQAASLHTIMDQIDRVSRIIRELLDFARPRPATGRPTQLQDAVRRVRELLSIEFENADLALQVDVPEDLPRLAADDDQLQQVLINLLINARDACVAGDTVAVTARNLGATVLIEVRDDGPGIPEEHLHRVFDPFFTSKKRGQGTGLGLSVVSQIVRSHHGEVTIDSAPGHGTVVQIRWPIALEPLETR